MKYYYILMEHRRARGATMRYELFYKSEDEFLDVMYIIDYSKRRSPLSIAHWIVNVIQISKENYELAEKRNIGEDHESI